MAVSKEHKQTTRLVIASDQAIYLRGLAAVVKTIPSISLVGEAQNSLEALQLCRLTEPDMILLDLKNPLEQGLEAARQICQGWPQVKTIVMLGAQEENQTLEALENSCFYFFSRDVSEDEFKAALLQMVEPAQNTPALTRGAPVRFKHHLEDFERDTLQLMTEQPQPGVHNREILTRELAMAGKIQEDILPERTPNITGWDLAARLVPARETSGDFYDFIPLTATKWGILVADVIDKGMGAALFMALSSTLLRTYATRFPTLPALTLNAVSTRILSDTRGGMFVTSFYGILEPLTGRFIYANAGHPPGLLISTRRGKETVEKLRRTGMALGVSEQAQWKQKVARLGAGDYLILYTDGITEAQNAEGEFFGDERLVDTALQNAGGSAQDILEALLNVVHRFVGNAVRQDDIALIVIRRLDD